jgi:hypothetical protein
LLILHPVALEMAGQRISGFGGIGGNDDRKVRLHLLRLVKFVVRSLRIRVAVSGIPLSHAEPVRVALDSYWSITN